jgi:hypothetical protein
MKALPKKMFLVLQFLGNIQTPSFPFLVKLGRHQATQASELTLL